MSLLDALTQALNANQAQGGMTDEHVDRVVHHAAPRSLGDGLAESFRSNQTPPIGDMVSNLFGRSNGAQQAGMLNQVLSSLGPAVAAAVAGGVLKKVLSPGATQVSPADAAKLSPQDVRDVVNAAHQKDPNVADAMGQFYAQHSGLIKTLGAGALVVALAKMKQGMNDN